jgi:UDP-galactopyranose mutase
LDTSVISRIPIRTNRDTRYFTDKYQGIPSQGYTKMFENILNHQNIKVLLNTSWEEIKEDVTYDQLYFTGTIDSFFKYLYGNLGYRSLEFEYETFYDREFYQEVAQVNYPNDYDFTRITEFKHLTSQSIPHTTIAREYSVSDGEPYYVIPNSVNIEKYKMYKALSADEHVRFIGRLAEYKYYNMDQIVEKVLNESI